MIAIEYLDICNMICKGVSPLTKYTVDNIKTIKLYCSSEFKDTPELELCNNIMSEYLRKHNSLSLEVKLRRILRDSMWVYDDYENYIDINTILENDRILIKINKENSHRFLMFMMDLADECDIAIPLFRCEIEGIMFCIISLDFNGTLQKLNREGLNSFHYEVYLSK